MASLVDRKIAEIGGRVWREITAPGGWLYEQIKRHVRWQQWGFEPGYSIRHRVAFTKSVAARLQEKGRGERLRLLGIPLWTTRLTDEWCTNHADILVTAFLKMEAVKFGHPNYDWSDGGDIADEDMANWERI